jgi:hypothetical protein
VCVLVVPCLTSRRPKSQSVNAKESDVGSGSGRKDGQRIRDEVGFDGREGAKSR